MPRKKAQAPDGMKVCTRCKAVLPLEDFHRMKAASDGRQSQCKGCQAPSEEHRARGRAYYAANLERERAKRREYGRTHRDEYRARYQRAMAADPEGMRARHREHARRHYAPIKEAGRIRREEERVAYLARIAIEGKPCSRCKETKPLTEFDVDRRYRSGHHSVCRECRKLLDREHTRKRRAIMREGKVEYDVILARHGMVCHLCGLPIATRRDLEMDHVVPLAKGGAHSEENVRPAHRDCNRRKGSRA